MICPNCKRENPNNVNFCAYCGTNMMGEVTSEQKTTKEDFVSGDISHYHLIKFIRHMFHKKQYGVLIYGIGMISFSTVCLAAINAAAVFIPSIIVYFSLNKLGQRLLCVIMGARRIERNELIVKLKNPVEAIIKEARANGLALPSDIEIYVVKYSEPIAYAIGMNTIIVSEQMALQNETVFKTKILTELYRINQMDTDYLLFMVGSNLIIFIAAICLAIEGRIDMKYGDRRSGIFRESESKNGALTYYGTLICCGIWIGICYLCIKSVVRKNTFAADLYAARNGYGEQLCLYIDQIMPERLPMQYKVLELGHPSRNERIAALQRAGVPYFSWA